MFFRNQSTESRKRQQSVMQFVKAPSSSASDITLANICQTSLAAFQTMEARDVTAAAKVLMKLAISHHNFPYATRALDMLKVASETDSNATILRSKLLKSISTSNISQGLDDIGVSNPSEHDFKLWCDSQSQEKAPLHVKLPKPTPAG